MKSGSIRISAVIPATPKQVYQAWMSSKGHSAMTGSTAKVTARKGGAFTAWDGYISGKTLELEPDHSIVQSWRTTDFEEAAADSRLEISLAETKGGTRVTLKHSDIPAGQASGYRQGWIDYYFAPMKEHFTKAR